MSRAFYSEYVNHCLRFYARHPNPKFKSDVDKHNWVACDNALKGFSDSDRELLMEQVRVSLFETGRIKAGRNNGFQTGFCCSLCDGLPVSHHGDNSRF